MDILPGDLIQVTDPTSPFYERLFTILTHSLEEVIGVKTTNKMTTKVFLKSDQFRKVTTHP